MKTESGYVHWLGEEDFPASCVAREPGKLPGARELCFWPPCWRNLVQEAHVLKRALNRALALAHGSAYLYSVSTHYKLEFSYNLNLCEKFNLCLL